MQNFHIQFAYPWSGWLMFLLIPAIALTLIPYFMLNKKYRRTRNRVISIVLHLIVMVLSICVLAGMTFAYQIGNLENEIILLVDVSDTEEESAQARDEFVAAILNEAQYDGFKVGVVTFGFTQNYAVPMTYEVNTVYDAYASASKPDTSATDIAAALKYTSGLFTPENLKTSKIVLVTDGKETDESAGSIIRSIAAQGTKIDIVHIPSTYERDNVQVTGVTYPDFHVNLNETFTLKVEVQSKVLLETATIEIVDNGKVNEEYGTRVQSLNAGSNTIDFTHIFDQKGLHKIEIRVKDMEDGLEDNNTLCSYIYVDIYDRILILEQKEGESTMLQNMLTTGDNKYNVDIVNLKTGSSSKEAADLGFSSGTVMPETVDDLRKYDQIILNNIANSDLPEGFDEVLYSYVYDFGGGLFTTGGNDDNGEAHAYNRKDMRNTLLQDMLPVQVIDYTPPVGVVVIIDVSGSMSSVGDGGKTQLEWAKEGAVACLDALTERDYISVMTLDTDYGVILPLTPRTQETLIKEAIMGIESGGATNYTGAIRRAGLSLAAERRIDKRHIILVSDGMPGDEREDYLREVESLYTNSEVTCSVVGVGMTAGSAQGLVMQEIADLGHGRAHFAAGSQLIPEMREDLNAPAIKEVSDEPFQPVVADPLSNVFRGVEYSVGEGGRTMDAELGGFYGTKKRSGVEPLLVGEYEVPIYAQWKVGDGMVGSFLCDLNGTWSSSFMGDPFGQRFLINVINNLMPTEDISPKDIRVSLKEDNYINQLSIVTNLADGERVVASIRDSEGKEVSLNEVTAPSENGELPSCYTTMALGPENEYSRCDFVIKTPGVYEIIVRKVDRDGNLVTVDSEVTVYKSFAYSKEYDYYNEESELETTEFLDELAKRGNGTRIDDIEQLSAIFENFITAIDRSFDPRILFMIIAMVLFLLDIAVRKFRFKWPHELYREYKERKASEKQ